MTYAYAAFYEPAQFPIAIFWDDQAAQAFARAENDLVQAAVVTIEAIAMVDRYGFPCAVKDMAIVAPWASEVAA